MKVLNDNNLSISLDAKDWRILNALVENPRISMNLIAKNIGLSRQSVEYRINKMKSNGLINGYRSIINIGKLGYKSYHVFLSLNTIKREKDFLRKVKDASFVNAIITYHGRYSYEISIMASSIEEFIDYYKSLVNSFSVFEEKILILYGTVKSEVLPKRFFRNLDYDDINNRKVGSKKIVKYDVDDIDLNIMKLLAYDGSMSYQEISKWCSISKDVAKYRVSKLLNSGYIVQFRPVINFQALGLSINTILLKLDYYEDKIDDFEKFQKMDDRVLWSARTFGEYNYIIYVLTSDLSEFHEFFEDIKVKFEGLIKTYELLFAYEQMKYSFLSDNVKVIDKKV